MPFPPLRVCTAIRCGSVLLVLVLISEAAAQSQSLFGNRGPISQQNQRRSGTGTTGFGTGTGSTGFGAGTGTRGTAGQQAAPGIGQVQSFSGGFVGRSDNVGRFVGQQQAGSGLQATPLGGAGRAGGGLRQRTNANPLNDPNNPIGGGFGGNQNRRQGYIVRPQQRIAFEYPARSASEVGTSVRTQFTQIADRRETLGDVRVETGANGVVTLRGEVATEDARQLAAAVARLEPGVREVRNELTVAGATPDRRPTGLGPVIP